MSRLPLLRTCVARSMAIFAIAAALAMTGCDTGSRGSLGGGNNNQPGIDDPILFSVSPLEACAGDTITLEGQNFSLVQAENIVLFWSQKDPDYFVPGTVRTATKSRLHVTVPGGVLSGTVELTVIDNSGTPRNAGVFEFGGCPLVTGVAIGNDARDGVIGLVGTQLQPSKVILYGYNLEKAVTVDMRDESGNTTVKIQSVQTPSLPSGAVRDTKVSAVSVEIPKDFVFLGLDGYVLEARVNTPAKTSNWGSFLVRKSGANSGALISGVTGPSGNRSGILEFRYDVFCEETETVFNQAPWTLSAEFSRDGGLTWAPATSAGSAEGDDRVDQIVVGDIEFPSEIGQLAGPGLAYRFRWDSEIDLAGAQATARLRFKMLPTEISQSSRTNAFESPSILVNNQSTIRNGSSVERFDDQDYEDMLLTTASWGYPNGFATGTVGTELPTGSGSAQVVLDLQTFTDNQGTYNPAYVFDTDTGRIYYGNRDGSASTTEFTVVNPGRARGEFHFATLEIQQNVVVKGIGARPLVIRLQGTGDVDEDAFIHHGKIDVNGADGEAGGVSSGTTPATAGQGGRGGSGGGTGGDAGIITIGPQYDVTGAMHATAGEGSGGGGAGRTAAYRIIDLAGTALSDAFGGAGGGASYGTLGTSGQSGGTTTLPPRKSGEPGPVYGTAALLPSLGGSGGGGGGGYIYRAASSLEWVGGGGSGGGGGGGAVQIVAAGSIDLNGEISADGGDGGAVRSRGGSGGGGSGGGILVQGTGKIEIGALANVHALGGSGGDSASGTSSRRSIGGNGGSGRIRFEAGKGVNLPNLVASSAFQPAMNSSTVTAGLPADPIDGGDGIDGAFNLPAGATGTYRVNTDTGEIHNVVSGLRVIQAASGGGLFRLSSLSIPRDVTLDVIGSQPLIFRVRGDAELAGKVMVNGKDATEANVVDGLPGEPGAGGPGGGAGGLGGYVDGGTSAIFHGQPGELPAALPASLIASGPTYGDRGSTGSPLPPGVTSPALGGETMSIPCTGCTDTGGGGGGGGYGLDGSNGSVLGASAAAGSAGLQYGSNYFLS
ncbi:MAG: hypothetical protein JXP34_10405, partial [Planctomycetes bacterium]|nr:hypothetical protein [Planctomycetota bacterium]